ncbi:uroporphyrinogen-III C-methyltransferase [Colwellia sp. 12G3]|uniref:uroporphyrinogen-III C-methyltransferase n=1 Tax=Colwellia sp. 12G3 TaxID=2058299 RepID=UPI000C335F2F|nr:uroporphyrinogen-III C-methyltransferase [Colwellia sp. 12G3]PKI16337.1 heme biosynthesis operon protein HemX [Colwellia sp. 12G3]
MEYKIMSDNEVSKSKLSDKSDTEKKETATLSSDSNAKVSSASNTPNTAVNKTVAKQPSPSNTRVTAEKSSNKTATIALVIASVSIFASIGHYVWQQQQTGAQLLMLSQQNQQAIQQSQAQLKSNLTAEFNRQLQQQHRATSESQQNAQQKHLDSDTQIQRLTAQISQLDQQVSQRQPSDWLIHEAEYLVRVAARTMWLERDTKAAINLLRDADNRLKELNHPKFLPVRALINEDIENLALMPTLTNQEAILTLMALNKQVPTLALAGVNLAEALDKTKEDFVLSDNIGDWQENLAKTWHKFLKDFITVRRRTGMVEPLMAPDQQQHLKQNLSLKIQLVQWAASEQKETIYQQTLLDIQQWLNEFFDMSLPVNKRFYDAIEQLKKQTINYDYPSDLRSLAAIKRLLQDTQQGTQHQGNKVESNKTEQVEQPIIDQNIKQTSTPKDMPQTENEEASGGQL